MRPLQDTPLFFPHKWDTTAPCANSLSEQFFRKILLAHTRHLDVRRTNADPPFPYLLFYLL